MEFQTQFDQAQAEIEAYLKQVFQGAQPRADLYDAMSYSLLAGGKRIPADFDAGDLPHVRR